jgi:hypothetical protein
MDPIIGEQSRPLRACSHHEHYRYPLASFNGAAMPVTAANDSGFRRSCSPYDVAGAAHDAFIIYVICVEMNSR